MTPRPLQCQRTFVLLLAASGPGVTAGCGNHDNLDRSAPALFEQYTQLEETADTSANVSLGDLDSDGDLDIVLAKGRHWPLVDFVLLNDGDGGFEERHQVGGEADRTYTAALADLDGDGDLDLVVGNDQPDDKRVYTNDGAGHFEITGTFGQPNWPTKNVTDLDADGDCDVVFGNRGSPGAVLTNDGTGHSFELTRFGDGDGEGAVYCLAIGDVDGDGDLDIVAARSGAPNMLYRSSLRRAEVGEGLPPSRPRVTSRTPVGSP